MVCCIKTIVNNKTCNQEMINTDKECQLIPIVHGPARIPHFSLVIISITVQLCT
jgi:hypothetical protein